MAAKRKAVTTEDKNSNLMFLLLLAVIVILGVLFYTWKEQLRANMRWKAWYGQQVKQYNMPGQGYKGY